MSEEEKVIFFARLRECLQRTQRALYERKAKLGENVVIGGPDGKGLVIPASEALERVWGSKSGNEE